MPDRAHIEVNLLTCGKGLFDGCARGRNIFASEYNLALRALDECRFCTDNKHANTSLGGARNREWNGACREFSRHTLSRPVHRFEGVLRAPTTWY